MDTVEAWGSLQATIWAWQQEVTPHEKLVLLVVANGTTNRTFIAQQTGLSEQQVEQAVGKLRRSGRFQHLTERRWAGMGGPR